MNIWSRIMNGLKAFREAYTAGEPLNEANFGDPAARALRYSINWAMYESTVYRKLVHNWADSYKAAFSLYKFIRPIYNPVGRLGAFWQAHLWGGALDPAAGDGKERPSALPVITDNENLRAAIAALWKASNWQMNKDLVSLWGPILGDVVIRVIDDTDRERVYFQVTHPGSITDLTLDRVGNVRGYVLEEQRADPREGREGLVTYREVCTRKPGTNDIWYETFLDKERYAWNGNRASWSEPYGFVPMVFIPHRQVGLQWGWCEIHEDLPMVREVHDLASMFDDQLRKMFNPAWFYAGVTKPKAAPTITGSEETTAKPEKAREDEKVIYSPDPSSKPYPLVMPVEIQQASGHIMTLLEELEKDYPELGLQNKQNADTAAELSGRAMRIKRQPVEDRVKLRRVTYDDALVRAQQMAVSIGGFREYEGYKGFNLDSYKAGQLDHQIGERPVFASDPLDDLEIEAKFWEVAAAAANTDTGVPLVLFLQKYGKERGWDDAAIAELQAFTRGVEQ